MKTYTFRFSSNHAKFEDGFITTAYGARPLATESKQCTLVEAIAYLPVFAESLAVPNTASFRIVDSGQRKPAGYNKARPFHFNPAALITPIAT